MKRLTRSALFFSFFLIISLGFISIVSAQASCVDNQKILRLSGNTNAHGEVWNGAGNYATQICYSSFGTEYPAGANVRTCIDSNSDGRPENLVLRLSGNTNAHAEVPSLETAGYQDVCYGDLVCQERTGECLGQEIKLLSLSGNTNAHLATTGYGTSICCTSANAGTYSEICNDGVDNDGDGLVDGADPDCADPSTCTLNDAYWADAVTGNPLPDNTQIVEHNPVKLILTGTGCNGLEVDFSVREVDLIVSWGSGVVPDEITNPVGSATFSGGKAELIWNTIWSQDDGGINDDPEYIFRGVLSLDSNKHRTTNTKIIVTPGDGRPPVANITAPVHRGIYYLNSEVTFSQNPGIGAPDNLQFLWTIRHSDGTSETFTNESFVYTFTRAGQDTITLRVTDPSTSLSDEDQVAIVVVASPGILAYINQPRHLELIREISGPSGYPRLWVNYNANDSFVMNNSATSSKCNGEVRCLAGFCPTVTQNVPVGCSENSLPVQNSNIGWSTTSKFNWEFGDSQRNNDTGNSGVTQRKLFGSASAGTVTTDMTLTYDDGLEGGININEDTERTFYLGQCFDNGAKWRYVDGRGVLVTVSTQSEDSNGVCKGADGLTRTVDDCCPTGLVCGDPGDGEIRCYDDGSDDNINYCQDYNEISNCVNDTANILRNDPQYRQAPECGTYFNGKIVECSCSWGTLPRTEGVGCYFNKTYTHPGIGTDDGNKSCLYEYEFGTCLSGYRTVNVFANWTSDITPPNVSDPIYQACVDEAMSVLCGSPSIDLNFFGKEQLIFSIIAVFLIYYLMTRIKKEKEK